jgi:hypothetical protein
MREWLSRGLASRQNIKRLKAFATEISERKQVGDIASMVNERSSQHTQDKIDSGHH